MRRPYNKINGIHTWVLKDLLSQYTTQEVADILGCSRVAIYKLIKRRGLSLHDMPTKNKPCVGEGRDEK